MIQQNFEDLQKAEKLSIHILYHYLVYIVSFLFREYYRTSFVSRVLTGSIVFSPLIRNIAFLDFSVFCHTSFRYSMINNKVAVLNERHSAGGL